MLSAATALLLLSITIGSPIAVYRINKALRRAEAGELLARQKQYASDMNLAHQAIIGGDFFRALRFLKRNRPENNSDLRGWEWRYFWNQCQGEPEVILGYHSNGVSAAGFLPDGKTAYSAGNDKMVRLWDLRSKTQVDFLPHEKAVTGCAGSPDGLWMATSTETHPSDQGPLRLWDLQNGQSEVLATNFWVRPNSSTLAYSENDQGDIALWDVPGHSRKLQLKGHRLHVTSLAFMPDSRALLSSSADKTVKRWNLVDGPERGSFTELSRKAEYLRMSPDGTVLATSSTERLQRVLLQEIPSGAQIRELIGHENTLTDAAFSPDGRTIITASLDGSVRLWPVKATPKQDDSRPYSGTIGKEWDGTGPALSSSPDGRNLLVVYADATFSIWDTLALSEGERQPLPISGFQCAALASGAKTAAFIAQGGKICLWDVDSKSGRQFSLTAQEDYSRAAFSPDGRRLAIGGWHDVRIIDPASKTLLREFHFRDKGALPNDCVMSLTFSAEGQKLMAGFYYGLVKVWDLQGRSSEVTFQGDGYQVRGLALLPDGRTVVSTSRDIRLWDLNSRQQICSFQPRPTLFHGASLSPDGRRLAIGAGDGLITIWDLASREEVATLRGHERTVDTLSFLSDGNTLVSVGLDQLRVWRAASFEEADREALKK